MLQPGSVLSRTVAIALLAIALLAGYRLIMAPVLNAFRDGKARIEQAEELLQRYEALAQQRPLLNDRLAEQEERAASAAGYLQGPSDAAASCAALRSSPRNNPRPIWGCAAPRSASTSS